MCDRLRSARLAAGFESAADAAQRLGLAAHTYRHYERGDRHPPLDVLPDIARLYKVQLEWLLTGKGDSNGARAEVVNIWDHILPADQPTALRMLKGLVTKN